MRIATASLDQPSETVFSEENHALIRIDQFLVNPDDVMKSAKLQKFAQITPQYPGIRAPLGPAIAEEWAAALSPLLSGAFNAPSGRWTIQAWYSLVTRSPNELAPIQCLPHVDGTDPDQIAMMLYLSHADHGGTAFFRHKSTGLEALTDETYPKYKIALEQDVARTGLPPSAYVTDGEPHFTRTYATEGRFNQAVFYRGNLFHSGVINNEAPLPADPETGRFTINAFLRPPNSA